MKKLILTITLIATIIIGCGEESSKENYRDYNNSNRTHQTNHHNDTENEVENTDNNSNGTFRDIIDQANNGDTIYRVMQEVYYQN